MDTNLLLAYRLLYFAYALLPIAAGIDKFFFNIGAWDVYINKAIPTYLNMSMLSFLHYFGVTEIIVGLIVLWAPSIGGLLVTLGLLLLAFNVLSTGHHWDVAVRDIVLTAGSISLVLLSQEFK